MGDAGWEARAAAAASAVAGQSTGISCDSCGSPVSPAAARASRGLDHVSPVTAAHLEQMFHVKLRMLYLCAECFLASYWIVSAGDGPNEFDQPYNQLQGNPQVMPESYQKPSGGDDDNTGREVPM